MKLAKIPVNMILKVIFWICRAYVCWYLDVNDLPDAFDIKLCLYPTKEDIEKWKEYAKREKEELEMEKK